MERACYILSNVELDKTFWAEIFNTTWYLVNRSPSTAIKCKIPCEVWFGYSVNYYGLSIFTCPTYVLVNDGKLKPGQKDVYSSVMQLK